MNNWLKREEYENAINIICTLFDGRNSSIPHTVGVYTPEWVDKLYRGIKRNYSGHFNFICLTDQNYKFKEDVQGIRLSKSVDQYGWMSLMDFYHPDICKGKRFTIGLDTIITGPLDELFSYNGDIGLVTDPYYPNNVCNAVSISNDNFCQQFWDIWETKEEEIIRKCKLFEAPSEMIALNKYSPSVPDLLDKLYPNKILSYKVHLKQNVNLLNESSLVYFHGNPKPHQLEDLWVKKYWI